MATKKQPEANRRNARRSTGPRTEPGKVRASRNALRHGLTSRQVVLEDEDGAAYEELRRDLHAELRPESELERLLVNRIAAQQWRLARIPALEAELLERLRHNALGQDEGLGAAWSRDGGGALAKLNRYEGALERNLLRQLDELRRVQAERRPGAAARAKAPSRPTRASAPERADAPSPDAKGHGANGQGNGHGANGHGPNGHGNGSGGLLN